MKQESETPKILLLKGAKLRLRFLERLTKKRHQTAHLPIAEQKICKHRCDPKDNGNRLKNCLAAMPAHDIFAKIEMSKNPLPYFRAFYGVFVYLI